MRMRRIKAFTSGTVCVAAVFAFALHGAAWEAQAVAGSVSESELAKWLITQGGLAVVLVAVLFQYRRDMVRLLADAKAENAHLLEALQETTAAMTAHAETSRQQTEAVASQARAIVDVTRVVEGCRAAQALLERAGQRV